MFRYQYSLRSNLNNCVIEFNILFGVFVLKYNIDNTILVANSLKAKCSLVAFQCCRFIIDIVPNCLKYILLLGRYTCTRVIVAALDSSRLEADTKKSLLHSYSARCVYESPRCLSFKKNKNIYYHF